MKITKLFLCLVFISVGLLSYAEDNIPEEVQVVKMFYAFLLTDRPDYSAYNYLFGDLHPYSSVCYFRENKLKELGGNLQSSEPSSLDTKDNHALLRLIHFKRNLFLPDYVFGKLRRHNTNPYGDADRKRDLEAIRISAPFQPSHKKTGPFTACLVVLSIDNPLFNPTYKWIKFSFATDEKKNRKYIAQIEINGLYMGIFLGIYDLLLIYMAERLNEEKLQDNGSLQKKNAAE